MWADLGAGKSHTLRHIQSRLLDDPASGMYPIYSILPRELKTFLDVYQAVLASLDLDRLGQMAIATVRSMGSKENLVKTAFPALPEAATALIALRSADENERNNRRPNGFEALVASQDVIYVLLERRDPSEPPMTPSRL